MYFIIYTIILHGFHLINEIKAFTSKLTVNFILLVIFRQIM